ncbi:unnamed protein product, partial [Musa hybrid cultivar]
KPSDSFSRATTAAFPRRSAVFLRIGEQRTQRRGLPPLSSCRCGVFLSIGETASPPPRKYDVMGRIAFTWRARGPCARLGQARLCSEP